MSIVKNDSSHVGQGEGSNYSYVKNLIFTINTLSEPEVILTRWH